MIKFLKINLIKILTYLFARNFFYKFNTYLFNLIIRFLGYNNCCDLKITGEINFIKYLNSHKPKYCIDIGASQGDYLKSLLKYTNSYIFAFEALDFNYKKLNKIKYIHPDRVHVINSPLGNTNEISKFYFNNNVNEIGTFLLEAKNIDFISKNKFDYIDLEIKKLDDFYDIIYDKLKTNRIDLIKIDVEGYEFKVLEGSKKIIEKFKPKFIQFEFNQHYIFTKENIYNFSTLMKDYNLYRIMPYGYPLIKIDASKPVNNIYFFANYVFVSKDIEL